MSPIKSVSDVVRIPRLGKIRLGIKVAGAENKSPYPKAVDYFVCPEEVQKVHGEKPKELPIMFPLSDPDQFAQQWLRCYSQTQGLVCIGDGEECRAKVDTETGEIASHTTKEWVWKDNLDCDPGSCAQYARKHCRRVLNLQFLLPSVPGLGVYQIDTSSFYSIVNINSMVRLLQGLFGRCSMLPLTLALGPVEISPPGMKKKTVYIMHIRRDDIRLVDLAKIAQLPVGRVLIPEPEAETPPDDLFPDGVLTEPGTRIQEPQELEEPKKRKTLGHKAGLVPASELQPPPDERLEVWSNIQAVLKRLGKAQPIESSTIGWFQRHFQIEVCSKDFEAEVPADKFTKQILLSYHDTLMQYETGLDQKNPGGKR